MNNNINDIIEKILKQEITIREASRITGISRDRIRMKIIEQYKDNPTLLRRVYLLFEDNKKNSATITVNDEKLEEQFWLLMNKEISLDECGKNLGIQDRETIKYKLLEFVQMSNNPEIMELFKGYIQKHNTDYTYINFRLVAIDMVIADYSQSEMAKILGLNPRTLSREFEKFEGDEDKSFYEFIKRYSGIKMRRQKFSLGDRIDQLRFIENYCAEHMDLLKETLTSRTEEKIKRERDILKQVELLREKGLTLKEIARQLGVSESYIRRAKINERQREVFNDVKLDEIDLQ